MLKRTLILILFILPLSCSTLPKHFVELDSGADLLLEDILRQIENESVVFVGEIHANPRSHRVQLEVIKHLYEKGRDVVIAIEMISNDRQEVLNRWIQGRMSEGSFARFFYKESRMPFRAYANVLRFAKTRGIPVVGIDANRKLIADVSKKGTNVIPEDYARKIRFSDCSSNPLYGRLLELSGGKQYHTFKFPYLCDGQRLRDTIMAHNIINIFKKGTPAVVVMAGNAHVLKPAIPGILKDRINVAYKVIVSGKVKGMINKGVDSGVADYIWY